MTQSTYQVVIIGAGPYGLAAAAHLRSAGVDVHVFGEAMKFWQSQMPAGMCLRSSWDASHISDPQHALTLNAFQTANGVQLSTPVPLNDFIAYGRWFQSQVVPDLDSRRVEQVEATPDGFELMLEDGDTVTARRVIVATGISLFAYRPEQFRDLSPAHASHSADHDNLGMFAGRQVMVVGSGQSAIESAALLHENGATVEVVMRAPQLRWLRRSNWLHHQPQFIRGLMYHPTDVGPPGLNQIVARPDLFRKLPLKLQQRIAYRSIRPAASGWLWPRTQSVRMTTGRNVVSATPTNGHVRAVLDDGTERSVDHILLATGYRIDVARYPFLAPQLLQALRRINGYPLLKNGFESSVAGLHFLGAPSAWSFGPLMRFVSGTEYTARSLARHVMAQIKDRSQGEKQVWPAAVPPSSGD